MGTPSFGLLPGNNAPPPPVFAGNNPTGGHFNLGGGSRSSMNSNFPNYPMFGNPTQSLTTGTVSPMANMPAYSTTNMQGLSTGLAGPLSGMPGNPGDHLYKEFVRAYGKGTGATLFQMLTAGQFNPQTASAFLNAMQPGVQRGESSLLNAFGAEGSRFGSAAALGLGDYESQVNLNEQQTLASLYMNAQQEQLSLLGGLLPTLHQEEADSGGNWFTHMLETGSGIALDIIGAHGTGTALFNKGQGINTTPLPSTGGGSSNPFANFGQGSFTIGGNNPSDPGGNFWDTYSQDQLTASGGDAIFAA